MWFTNVDEGLMVGEKTTPIVDVCLYVPRGKGSFPSVLLMLGVPAVVAGVEKIVVVTPPNEQGGVDDAILAAAKLSASRKSIKSVGFRPLHRWRTERKRFRSATRSLAPATAMRRRRSACWRTTLTRDFRAGPSECIILADEHADAHKAALDWMIEAEHGPDSAALLVTHSEDLAKAVVPIMKAQLEKISEKRRSFIETNYSTYGGIILTDSLEESIAFVNEYAPEHMEVMCKNPFDILPKIKNAGEILLGEYAPVTLCNFVLGPNAILPTGWLC